MTPITALCWAFGYCWNCVVGFSSSAQPTGLFFNSLATCSRYIATYSSHTWRARYSYNRGGKVNCSGNIIAGSAIGGLGNFCVRLVERNHCLSNILSHLCHASIIGCSNGVITVRLGRYGRKQPDNSYHDHQFNEGETYLLFSCLHSSSQNDEQRLPPNTFSRLLKNALLDASRHIPLLPCQRFVD